MRILHMGNINGTIIRTVYTKTVCRVCKEKVKAKVEYIRKPLTIKKQYTMIECRHIGFYKIIKR